MPTYQHRYQHHATDGAFKPKVDATDWNIKKVLQSAFQILHDCSTRLKEHEYVTTSSDYQLYFCVTRFVFRSQTVKYYVDTKL